MAASSCSTPAPGFTDGLVRNMMISAEWNESQAGFTLATGQPTVVNDYGERGPLHGPRT